MSDEIISDLIQNNNVNTACELKIKNVNGIIIDNTNNYISNDTSVEVLEDGVKILKTKTNKYKPYQWCGYSINSIIMKTIMSFDIKFISDIPSITDDFYIKTHTPVIYYNKWLSECVKNEFTHIELTLYSTNNQELIIFLMDNYLNEIEFIIRNVEFKPFISIDDNIIKEFQNPDYFISETYTKINPINVNGIIIDNKYNYISNETTLEIFNDEIKITKNITYNCTSYQWCGYRIIPEINKMIMSFDIKFLTNIPDLNKKFYIKTHNPIIHYYNWLSECKKNDFAHIELSLFFIKNKNEKNEELIIFMMDEYFNEVSFIIKNLKFTPRTGKY